MGSDEPKTVPKLPLFSMLLPPHLSEPEPSGTLTPPLQTSASVPFRWEQEPGKPLPCTDLILHTTPPNLNLHLHLHLPPRLASTKTSSPTTVLDNFVLSSSSFRLGRERRRSRRGQGSFDSSCSGGSPNPNPNLDDDTKQLQLEHQSSISRGLFGSFRLKGKPVISVSMDAGFLEEKNGKRMRRNSSLSKVTRSHFWASIYEGFKHVVPWKKKAKKEL